MKSRDSASYDSGRDAAYIKPKFIPDDQLLPRDDSGGLGFEPYTAKFGDGGRVTGAKDYLSATGGDSPGKMEEDEPSRAMRGSVKVRKGD